MSNQKQKFLKDFTAGKCLRKEDQNKLTTSQSEELNASKVSIEETDERQESIKKYLQNR